MKGKKCYTISSKEENEINQILDSGLSEVNYQTYGTVNSNQFESTYQYKIPMKSFQNINSIGQMKNDLQNLQSNINKLEEKLFTSTPSLKINNSLNSNRSIPLSTVSSSIKINIDYKEKLAQKENEILKLRMQIEKEQREKEYLQKQMEKMTKDFSDMNIKMNNQMKEIESLKECKSDYEKLRRDYHTLFKEYKYSEELRNEQKNLIRNMQDDIDAMRKASYNRIYQIEMNGKIAKDTNQEEVKSNCTKPKMKSSKSNSSMNIKKKGIKKKKINTNNK